MSPARVRRLLAVWALLTFWFAVRALGRGLVGDQGGCEPTLRAVQIDLNRAAVGELSTLPGIGPARAEAIVLDRVRRGAFRTVADLDRVDGLGSGIVAQVRPFACCEPADRIVPP